MKDAAHHLKHIQKKVIQSVRREQKPKNQAINGTEFTQTMSTDVKRKVMVNK